MGYLKNILKLTFASGCIFLASLTLATAQSVFCPAAISSGLNVQNNVFTPFRQEGVACTNGHVGAFSGAALASQALSTLSQSTVNESNRSTMNAIERRREEEAQRCPLGQVRTASGCQAIPAPRPAPAIAQPAPRPAPAVAMPASTKRQAVHPPTSRAAPRHIAAQPVVEAPPPVAPAPRERARPPRAAAHKIAPLPERVPAQKAPSIPQVSEIPPVAPILAAVGPSYGVFAQGFGDYEHRTGTATSSLQYQLGPQANSAVDVSPFTIQQSSRTATWGFLAGADVTLRGNFLPEDIAIVGLLTGYTTSSIQINTTSIPSPLTLSGERNLLPASSGVTNVNLDGPSVGAYLTYLSGGFSFDQTLKADFFTLSQNFFQFAGFTGWVNKQQTGGSAVVPLGGYGTTQAILFSALGNMNFRFLSDYGVWIEPTAGYQYTHSMYDNGARLNLADGDRLLLQAGARIGADTSLYGMRVRTTFTGLAYDNVIVSGGFLAPGIIGGNVIALNDQGKLRGQGIVNVALDHGSGFSTFIQGDVRGGDQYFGVGGRVGLRYQW